MESQGELVAWERYKSKVTGFETQVRTGKIFYIRSYCDDPQGGVFITKEPVCKLLIDPTTQFPNANIAWDISLSSSATGTIDTFDIDWGGATDIGDLAAQDWATDPKSGNVQYDDVGEYTIEAYVTDTLGARSKVARINVTIEKDSSGTGIPASLQRCYIGTTDKGLYIATPTTDPAQSVTGLSGDDLKFRSCRLHPAYRDLPGAQQHLWACTANGVAYTTDGGANWSTISKVALGDPENAAGDGPAPITADLDQIDLWFDPINPHKIYVLRTTATRAWIYSTASYGLSWGNNQIGGV